MRFADIGRAPWLVLTTAALLTTSGVAGAQESLAIHGLKFPARIQAAERGSTHNFEKDNPGLGHSVHYRAPDWAITVYIYDLGRDKIPDDPRSEIVKAQLDAAKREVDDVRTAVEWRREFTIDGESRKPRFICASCAFKDEKSQPLDSFICLTAWKNKFIKYRLTTRPRQGTEAEAIRFMRAWVRVLWPPPPRPRDAS
jgi:hypothetical protein